MYCTKCGAKMAVIYEWQEKVFNKITGRPVFIKKSVEQCENFTSVFHDGLNTNHDRDIVNTYAEKATEGLATQPFIIK